MRVVSLLPSATEIVCALGREADLVGISHECDFPARIRDRRVVTRARVELGATSRAIDEAVRRALADALSIYAVDEAALAELAPDVILTQDLCEVCAVSLDDVRAAARCGQIVSLSPARLGDVLDDVERVGRAIGVDGAPLRAELEARMAAVTARVGAARPRVVTIEWLDPLMIGGTWMPELVERAGGLPIGATAGGPAPTIDLAQLRAYEPDVVVLKPCGFTIARSLDERRTIETIRAALPPTARLYLTDGNAYFNRPGPRLVESLEILAACIHPAVFGDLHADAIVAY